MSNLISCPNCAHEIAVNEVLQNQISADIQTRLEAEMKSKQRAVIAQQKEIDLARTDLAQQRLNVQQQVQKEVELERTKLTAEAKQKAEEAIKLEIKDKSTEIDELKTQLSSAKEKEISLRKKERELETKSLEMERKVTEALAEEKQKIERAKTELAQQRLSVNQEVRKGIETERERLVEAAKKDAQEALEVELKDQQSAIDKLEGRLKESQTRELEVRKKERELKEKTDELELKVARELEIERGKIRQSAMKQFADEHQLKDAERQKRIDDMRRQIDDLKRKAEQGSMQTQGEVQELALESMLEQAFPHDSIEPIGKGINGADCEQFVRNANGISCGSILWESKRTKSFSPSWLPKLRDDQRAARASIAILVTQSLPEETTTFTMIDGVWVCSWQCAKALAMALRSGMIELNKNQVAAEGRKGKMEQVYNYLSGVEFRQSMEGIVEAFVTMKGDLDSEKRAMQRLWKKREKQLERALDNTAGMYGDLQGIVGRSLTAVEGLELDVELIESS